MIGQITAMGFDRLSAQKALKETEDVNSAINILLEGRAESLPDVSDSDNEEEKKDEQAKQADEKKKEEDLELKKKEEKRKLR